MIMQYGGLPGGYNPHWEIPTGENIFQDYFNIRNILLAWSMVFATDILFFMVHKLLHERLPRIHKLHHCCVYSSQSTNLFFHPIDLAMEFTAPVVAVWIGCCCIPWFDSQLQYHPPWIFALCSATMIGWYAAEHDEWLKFDHVKHHRGCATGYFIYNNYFYDDYSKEMVRFGISEFQKSKNKNISKMSPQ